MKKIIFAVLLMELCLSFNGEAAQRHARKRAEKAKPSKMELGIAGGVYLTPDAKFDLQVHGEYFVASNVSLGMNTEFILGGANFSFLPFVRYHFHLDSLPRFVPYIGMGFGYASYVQEVDILFGTLTDRVSLFDVMPINVGFKYEVVPNRIFLGSDIAFHVVTDFSNHGREWHLFPLTIGVRF